MKVRKDNSCRKCNHIHWWELSTFDISNCADPSCKCRAEDWLPFDNLEYLEVMTEKRSKV
jgi:hypothetical protein